MSDYSSCILYYFCTQGMIVDNSQLGCCSPAPPNMFVALWQYLADKEPTTAPCGVTSSRGYRQALCKAVSEMAG